MFIAKREKKDFINNPGYKSMKGCLRNVCITPKKNPIEQVKGERC